jgi:Gluconate 2-dehydrogenase subunit 3
MGERRYPASMEELFEGLDARDLEPDLRKELRERVFRERRGVRRVGEPDTVVAVAARLVPGAVPARALAAFVDEVFDQQKGRGDEQLGLLPRSELMPAGFRALDDAAQTAHRTGFAELGGIEQDDLLARAERGDIEGPEGFDSATWFRRVRELLLLGYGSDPRGMVQMGFPGPSYTPGHLWLDVDEVAARERRLLGYKTL